MFQQLKKTAVVLCVLLFAPITVYGYASTIDVLNANWKSKTLTVCIVNNAEEQYEDLFIDAVNTWSRSWPYLNYNFGDPDIDNCNIKAFIVVAYADLTSKGHAGETHTTYQIGGGIIKSDILIPTEQERKDGSTVRVTSKSFHRVAQHEFGHSIGLRHALDENYVEPVDIMAPILAPDDKVMLISSNDIDVLNNLYNVVTEFIPPEEPVIEPLPSPTPLPQVLQKMRINIERAVYYNNETLKFTVVPPATVSGIEANIILYPPGSRDGTVLHEAPDRNGIINVEVPLQDKALGIWNVKVSYVSWVSESAFALKDAGSVTEIESVGDEFSIKVDKSQYSLGEAVAVYGTAPKQSGWWLEVLDSNGRLFTQIDISSMKLKSDGTYEAIFTLVGDPVKSLGIWKIRIMEDSDPTVEKKSVTLDVVAPITEDFLTYENVTHGIKIKYPVDWENEEVGEVAGTLIVRFWSPLAG
ncbi:MAG: matrixin family metalloprotease, partial [Nitrososphaerales archaeon]